MQTRSHSRRIPQGRRRARRHLRVHRHAHAGAALRAPKAVAKDAVDSFLAIGRDGRVTVFTGKVDLGTGTRTALAQMVAEELDVAFERIDMVMGDTATTPDQWLTGGQPHHRSRAAAELRQAAATAREALFAMARRALGRPASELAVEDGVVRVKTDASRLRHLPGSSSARTASSSRSIPRRR